MKYLKRYKLFESNSNESYFELVEILQSKVFDDFDIEKGTDDIIDLFNKMILINSGGEDNIDYDYDKYPTHSFWLYTCGGNVVSTKDLNTDIDAIFVYNISESDHENFSKSLKSLETLVEDIIGKKLVSNWTLDDDSIYNYAIQLK
jgi:hypothetical protein